MTSENFYNKYYEHKLAGSRLRNLFKVSEHLIRYNIIKILRANSQCSEQRIIDISCGRGHLTRLLTRFGKVTGTDLSSVAVDYCKKKYPNIEFIVLDVFDAEWFQSNKEKFDIVVSTEVIEHLPADRQKEYLSNLRSLLKDGGLMIITTPNRMAIDMMKSDPAMSNQEFYVSCGGQPVQNLLNDSELRNLLDDKNKLILHEMISPLITNRTVDLLLKLIAMPTGYVLLQWIQKIFHLPGKTQLLCLKK
jgi:2-polyprenyl-3-methyl-5-hydroxy-6-metoxy-1,4-benzoquinol methylase